MCKWQKCCLPFFIVSSHYANVRWSKVAAKGETLMCEFRHTFALSFRDFQRVRRRHDDEETLSSRSKSAGRHASAGTVCIPHQRVRWTVLWVHHETIGFHLSKILECLRRGSLPRCCRPVVGACTRNCALFLQNISASPAWGTVFICHAHREPVQRGTGWLPHGSSLTFT